MIQPVKALGEVHVHHARQAVLVQEPLRFGYRPLTAPTRSVGIAGRMEIGSLTLGPVLSLGLPPDPFITDSALAYGLSSRWLGDEGILQPSGPVDMPGARKSAHLTTTRGGDNSTAI